MSDWYATPKQLANGHRTIHNDEDCCALSFADETVVVDRTNFADDEVCDACRRRDENTPQCEGLHQRLEQMDAREVFADD